jgi:ATP-dependent Clp protease ATP-binding subunit ClpC
MFERYDEPARRTLFFARFEASRLGMPAIETEHLLLGLMREPRGPAGRLLLTLPLADIRKELETGRTGGKISTSVEIPFSAETKRVLQHARDEADALSHRHIGPEHLLLGLLRESGSRAAHALARYGMGLEGARERIRDVSGSAAANLMPKSAVLTQLEQITESARQLRESLAGHNDAGMAVHMLLVELETLKTLLDERQ